MPFGRGKSNHTLARCVFFLPTLFYKKHWNIMFWWKNMTNTIGKKNTHFGKRKHTTLSLNKAGMWFHSKGCIFLHIIVFSSYTVVRILVGRLYSCFPTHTKKYMTPIHTFTFQKHITMCVCIRHIKSRCKLITLWGSMCSTKWLAGKSFLQNSGSQGLGA